MKHVLIVENATEKLVKESVAGSNKMLLNGIFTEFDVENRNKRFYKADNFIPCMNSLLEKKKMLGVLYGEFDHPDVFDIAGKNISHAIENLSHNESSNRVDGSIALLTTHWGKEARAIINDGYPLFVSSRAAGVTDGSGNVMLKELFTYDIVVDPGFASAQVSVNESLGFGNTIDVPYRIYEMNDSQVNNLFNDNKNDRKTKMDIKEMETFLATEMAKLEHQILTKITEGKTAPEDIKVLVEKHQAVEEELSEVKKYLDLFQKKISHLMSENAKLVEENKKLSNEVNENTMYSNHIQSGLNNVKEHIETLTERVTIDELFIESVAKETEITQMFAESIAKETEVTQLFVESVAKETEIAQLFAESIAKETEIAQMFTESIAKETEIAQMFTESVAKETEITRQFAEFVAKETEVTQGLLEHVASELQKDDIYLSYIAEKVDGIIDYNSNIVSKIKTTIPLSESLSEADSIHSIEDINDYLGLNTEQEIVNNVIEENFDEEENEESEESEEVVTETPEGEEGAENEEGFEGAEGEEPLAIDAEETETIEGENDEVVTSDIEGETVETPEVAPAIGDFDMTQNDTLDLTTDDTNDATLDTSMETTLLSALVKILGSDETGIVMEITPDNKLIIQKTDSDETFEAGQDEVEVLETEDNVAERVSTLLDEIKKQNALANQQPHFFSFLSEDQITDFKLLEKDAQNNIILAFENAEYFNSQDVLNIIGETLNKSTVSYEDNLISNIPTEIKEAWNVLTQDQKVSIITESKYFPLYTKGDIKSFWNTRPFAKAVNSPEATLIKESLLNDKTELNENYTDAFLKAIENLK